MPKLLLQKFNPQTGNYDAYGGYDITLEEQILIIGHFSAKPRVEGFYRYKFELLDGSQAEAYSLNPDVIGYVNEKHLQPLKNNGTNTGAQS